jgi:hypothetical protein
MFRSYGTHYVFFLLLFYPGLKSGVTKLPVPSELNLSQVRLFSLQFFPFPAKVHLIHKKEAYRDKLPIGHSSYSRSGK